MGEAGYALEDLDDVIARGSSESRAKALWHATDVLVAGEFSEEQIHVFGEVITRLTETWRAEQRAFAARDLSGVDYVYLWADGIHVNIRLEEHKLCLLVLIGVRADGRKELIALADGYRESAEVGRPAARLRPPRHARPGPGRR